MHDSHLKILAICLTACLLFTPIIWANQPVPVTHIIGGTPSPEGKWPSMVSLVQKNETLFDGHFCGGTIIDAIWILTAAHCVRNKSFLDIQVATGVTNLLDSASERLDVSQIIIHPMHQSPGFNYDFALLKLSQASTQPRSGIYMGSTRFNGSTGTTIGWGSTTRLGVNFPTQLQELDLPIVTNQACGSIIFDSSAITENMICAGDLSGLRDICGGDSGSPLFVKIKGVQVQVGITSFGFTSLCADDDSYSVWARVSSGIDFIVGHVPNALLLNEDNIPDPIKGDILDLIVPVLSSLKRNN